MFRTCSLTLFEKDFKILQFLIALGKLFHIFGSENLIDCWQMVNLYAGEMFRLLLLVEMRLGFD